MAVCEVGDQQRNCFVVLLLSYLIYLYKVILTKRCFVFLYICSGSRILQPAQVCDVLKGIIMVLCYFMMHYVDYAMMYHLIRGQSVIKLYIIYNMLEVWQHNACTCFAFPQLETYIYMMLIL